MHVWSALSHVGTWPRCVLGTCMNGRSVVTKWSVSSWLGWNDRITDHIKYKSSPCVLKQMRIRVRTVDRGGRAQYLKWRAVFPTGRLQPLSVIPGSFLIMASFHRANCVSEPLTQVWTVKTFMDFWRSWGMTWCVIVSHRVPMAIQASTHSGLKNDCVSVERSL